MPAERLIDYISLILSDYGIIQQVNIDYNLN